MNVLFVLTSHEDLGNTGHKTGFWIEEFAAPYYVLTDAGIQVTLASPAGGQPPIDPASNKPENQTEATRRFEKDNAAREKLSHTLQLAYVSADEYDAVFYPGGHGPLWDLTNDGDSIALIGEFIRSGKPVAAVCHAPAALLNVKNPDDSFYINEKNVTGFTNEEEAAVNLTDVVPFLLEDALTAKGGQYSKAAPWQSYVVTDGLLITGQNPASSAAVAEKLMDVLRSDTK